MGNIEEDGMPLLHWQASQVQALKKHPRSNEYPPSALTTKGWGWICIYAIATKSTGKKGAIMEETINCNWADEGQLAWP